MFDSPFNRTFSSEEQRRSIRSLPNDFSALFDALHGSNPEMTGYGPFKYLKGKGFKSLFALPNTNKGIKTSEGLSSVIHSAGSIFSIPALKYTTGGIKHILDVTYERMAEAARNPVDYLTRGGRELTVYPSKFNAIKAAQKEILERSRSTLKSSLGPDYTLAYHRSNMIDINELNVNLGGEYGSATVGEHLSKVKLLFEEYSRSGGFDLLERQRSAEDYYRNLLNAVNQQSLGGKNINTATVKDILFRKSGIASLLSPIDITSSISVKQLSKGIHQVSKLLPMQYSALRKYGFDPPIAVGRKYIEETRFINQLARFHGTEAGRVNRFSGRVFFAIGEGPLDSLKPLSSLGDSYAIGGKGLFNVMTRDYSFGGINTAVKKLMVGGISSLDDIQAHPELLPYIKQIMEGRVPEGMKRTASGMIRFNSPLQLRPVEGPNKMSFWLGTSHTKAGRPQSESEIASAAIGVNRKYKRLNVAGIKYTGEGGGAIEIEYERANMMRGRSSVSVPMLLSDKRLKVSARNKAIKTTSGERVDMIVRLKDLTNLDKLSPEFLQSNIMPYFQGIASERKALKQFVGAMSGYSKIGRYTSLSDISTASPEIIEKNFKNLLRMSNRELESIGLTRSEVHGLLTLNNETISINKNAIKEISGSAVKGLLLTRQTLARRAGQLEYGKIGRGAFKMRMHDILPALENQMAGIPASSELFTAYSSIKQSMLSDIFKGRKRLGLASSNIPSAAEEFVSLLLAQSGQSSAIGGLFSGMKSHAETMDIHEWFNKAESGQLKPLSNTRQRIRRMFKGNGLLESDLSNTIHSFGPDAFQGLNLVLPQQIETQIAPGRGNVIKSNKLYIPTDDFLGAAPKSGQLFLSSYGIRDIGMARAKAEFMTQLYEEMKAHKGVHGNTKDYKMSQELQTKASAFSTSMRWAMPGKKGLLYHRLIGEPSGGFRLSASPLSAVKTEYASDPFVAALNEFDMKRILKKAGYSKEEAATIVERQLTGIADPIYGTAIRHPVYRGQNLAILKYRAHRDVERGSIHINRNVMENMFGDFDWDTVFGSIDKSQQGALSKIHTHRTKLLEAYSLAVDKKDIEELKALREQIINDTWSFSRNKYANITDFKKDIQNALVSRYKGAAGGGALVGPVFMQYSKLSMVANALNKTEGNNWINTLAEQDPQLAKELINLKNSAKDSNLLHHIGLLKESGIYGTLKKGSEGFGTSDYSTLEALMAYSKDASALNKNRVISGLKSGYLEGLKGGTVKVGELLGDIPSNLTNERIADLLTERLTSGKGHEGILSVAKAYQAIRQHELAEPIEELFRGRNPLKTEGTLNRRLNGLFERLIGFEPIQESPSNSIAADAVSRIEKMSRISSINQQTKEEAKRIGRTVFRKAGDTLRELATSKWGKASLIGAGIIAGIGAIDSLVGMFEDNEEPPAPEYARAPLPPDVDLSLPDKGIQYNIPRINHYKTARLERPMATRNMYNISAETDAGSNTSYMTSGYMGNSNKLPGRSSHTVDHRRNMDEQEMSYQIRARLNSSF